MLGVEWTSQVGEGFTENLLSGEHSSGSSMFHGTIDLIGSSDDDYESDLVKPEAEALNDVSAEDCDVIVQVEEGVKTVVNNLVDFVERNMMFPEFGYDPDVMVKSEFIPLKEGSCMKPHCQLGCLCSSLRGAFQHVPTHCSKERCMFECHCQERGLSAIDDENHYADKSKRKKKIPNRFKDVVLGRAYKKLHARTIHDAHDPDSESDSDYETVQIPAYKKSSPTSSPPKVPSPEPKNSTVPAKSDNSWIHSDKMGNIKKTILERRIGFVTNTISDEQTLADVNIWCSQHNKYSCLCINYVYFSKTNYLLWKPSNKSRYLANKVMFEISLKEPSLNEIPYEVFPYNRNSHCARTYGALLDYNVRNKDEVFVTKRKLELEHNILSYSNSYVKFKNFLLVKASHPVPSAEAFNKCGRKRGMGKVISVVKTAEKVKVEVGEENLEVRVSYQLDEGNSEEEDDQKTKVSGRKRKLTQKMKELEEERKREREAEIEDMKKIEEEARLRKAMEEVPAKVPRKRGRPPKPKPDLIMEKSMVVADRLGNKKSSMHGKSVGETTTEAELVPSKKNGLKLVVEEKKEEEVRIKQEPASPDYFSAESRMDMEVEPNEDIHAPAVSTDNADSISACGSRVQPPLVRSKALKDCLKEFGEDIPKPFLGFPDCDESETEDCDSDFVDSIHSKKVLVLSPRSDGYPHLGLLCLTPGVGYLSVTESRRGKIVVVDPIDSAQRHTFDNLRNANDWLNRLFRSKVPFSAPELVLQWILVTPGILKLKQSKPVKPEIFEDPNMVITCNGPVRFAPSHRNNISIANNCSLLRKQLSEHSVFRPLIRKQLALRVNEKESVNNPKFEGSKWVPNPKFGKKVEKGVVIIAEQSSKPTDSHASFQRVLNVSCDTSVTRIPLHGTLAIQPSRDTQRRSPQTFDANVPRTSASQDTHRTSPVPMPSSVDAAFNRAPPCHSSRYTQLSSPVSMPPPSDDAPLNRTAFLPSRDSQWVPPQSVDFPSQPPRFKPFEASIASPQATLRPMPSLTKILSNKFVAKLSDEKGFLN